MRTDKLFVSVGVTLFVGFWIGFAAGLDNPPAQNDIQWETLLAGAVAIVGGWMAYRGATAPFREEQKTKNLKFFMNMRKRSEDLRCYFVWGKDGYTVRDPLFRTMDGKGNLDETKNDLKKLSRLEIATIRYTIYHLYMTLPDIPADILTRDLYKIRSDFRNELQTFLIETKVDRVPIEVMERWYQEGSDNDKCSSDPEDGPININEIPEHLRVNEEDFLKVDYYYQINKEFHLFEKMGKIAKIMTKMHYYMLNNT